MPNLRPIVALAPTVLLAPLAIALWPCSGYAEPTDVSPRLRKDAECMYEVLKTMPGVSEPKLGYVTSDGWNHMSSETWNHPYLEYRAAEESPSVQHPRFEAIKLENGRYYFLAVLSGLGAPHIHVTEAVIQKWKAQCGVEANVLFP